MNFDEVIAKRRSIRNFKQEKKVSKEQIFEIIKTAQLAPSWKNSQTGRYYVVMEPNKLSQVRACLAPQNQIVTQNVNALIITTFVKNISGFKSDGTPDNELGNGWGAYDLGLQNALLLLKATDMGIDSIVLGLRDAAQLRQVLAIADDEEVGAVIALGYRNVQNIPQPKRKDLSEIVHLFA